MAKLTVEQRIERAVTILLKYPGLEAMGGVLMTGKRTVVENCPTAATDGVNEIYGRAFVEKLSDAELTGLILHEGFHKMYRHLFVWKHLSKRAPELTNIAMDFVINLPIQDICDQSNGVIALPPGGCLDEKYRGMSVVEVFRDLKNNHPNMQDRGGFDEHDWEGAAQRTDAENEKYSKQIEEAVRQGRMIAESRKAGEGAGGLNALIDQFLTPKVNWRVVLQQFVKQHCAGTQHATWRRPKRRYVASGLYMPSNYSRRVDEIVDACDTSGSMWGYRSQVRSEILSIAKMVKPKVMRHLDWDTAVESDTTIRNGVESEVKTLPVRGGGGTDVSCVPNYLNEHKIAPKALIVMTDGIFNGWGKNWPRGTKVLWIIFGNKDCRPPFGTVVHVNEVDFEYGI